MNCHGLKFSLNALADKTLLLNNFKGKAQSRAKNILEQLKNHEL